MSHIEKEKLIKADIASIENRVRHAFNQGYDLGFKDGKEKAKGSEQKPETGHWIDDTRLGYHVSICSNCGWRGHGDTCLIYKPKYCPNCGAKMVEPQERSEKE